MKKLRKKLNRIMAKANKKGLETALFYADFSVRNKNAESVKRNRLSNEIQDW